MITANYLPFNLQPTAIVQPSTFTRPPPTVTCNFRKAAVSENWRSRAAEEAELVLSDAEDSEEEFYQVHLTAEMAHGNTGSLL